jgi:hypothetical protein
MSDFQPISQWRRGAPAESVVVDALTRRYPGLPAAYLAFLRVEDGSEGDLAVAPDWIQLWPAAEVEELNAGYEIASLLPGFIGFGSNGGNQLFAFDTRAKPWRICMVPCIPMDESEVVAIAADFTTLALGFGVAAPRG